MIEEENDIVPGLDVTMQTQDGFSFNLLVFREENFSQVVKSRASDNIHR